MATRSDSPRSAPVEQATAGPGERRDTAPRAGGVDGVKDQAEAREQAEVTPGPVGGGSPGESSDPAVHHLLAERQTAELNGDADTIKDIDKRLSAAGYKVG